MPIARGIWQSANQSSWFGSRSRNRASSAGVVIAGTGHEPGGPGAGVIDGLGPSVESQAQSACRSSRLAEALVVLQELGQPGQSEAAGRLRTPPGRGRPAGAASDTGGPGRDRPAPPGRQVPGARQKCLGQAVSHQGSSVIVERQWWGLQPVLSGVSGLRVERSLRSRAEMIR